MPRGVPQIEVTFDVDAIGILNVSAAEKSSGKSNKITITNDKARLSKDEVERLVAEAEKYAEEDKKHMEKVEARNGLESYLYNVRNTLNEDKVKDALSADDLAAANATVEDGLKWLSDNETAGTDYFKEKMKTCEQALGPIMKKLGGGGAPEESAPSKEPIIEEVD
jgi:L1 cell adhesion molecule like protein